MGALLGGGEALPVDNMGAMSGSVPEAGTASTLGALSAHGGAMNDAGMVEGLLSSLNPVQQVGLQGLLGAINPIRGGQAATPTGQPLPVAAAAPSSLPQASPPSLPVAQANATPGAGTMRPQNPAGQLQSMMRASRQPEEQQQKPTTTTQTPPVSQPTPMAYDWSGYRQQARDATQGMQQMPYVFSGYDQINGQNVSDIMKMFHPGWSPSGPATTDKTAERPGDDQGATWATQWMGYGL